MRNSLSLGKKMPAVFLSHYKTVLKVLCFKDCVSREYLLGSSYINVWTIQYGHYMG